MIDKNDYIHDLAMLRLKSEDISDLTNEQLMNRYMDIVSELINADRKYGKLASQDLL